VGITAEIPKCNHRRSPPFPGLGWSIGGRAGQRNWGDFERHFWGVFTRHGQPRRRGSRGCALLTEQPAAFWPRQYDNPDNALAYARLAELALGALGCIDCLVGSGGSLCGTARVLRCLFPVLRVVAVDTHRSCLFGHAPGPRLLRGLGNSILPANLEHGLVDEVHWVGAMPSFAAARRLHRSQGLYRGPSSGAAWLVASWWARHIPAASDLVILPDEGHRYRDSLHDDAWLARLEGWPPAERTEPATLGRVKPGGEEDWTWNGAGAASRRYPGPPGVHPPAPPQDPASQRYIMNEPGLATDFSLRRSPNLERYRIS